MHGEVLKTKGMSTFPKNHLLSNDAVTKERIGLDAQYLYGPYVFKGELAYGQDDNEDVLGYLFELDYTLPKHQNVQLELQFQSWINDIHASDTDDSTLSAGISYKLNENITLRTLLAHDFNLYGEKEDDKALLQFYYFGN